MPPVADERITKVEALQNMLLAHATDGVADNEEYQALRAELLQDPAIGENLPRFVRSSRDLGQFWAFIKAKFSTYRERRQFIWSEFAGLFEELETKLKKPARREAVSVTLGRLNTAEVEEIWHRALERQATDPQGAITAARTLLETVCKHILDDLGVAYGAKDDLPKLYSATAAELNLSPAQHLEQVFKQILGGCHAVVEGLAAVRNRLGDAHGQGRKAIKPAPRHAELAVNLAGSMAVFLVATWSAKTQPSSPE